MAIAPGTYRLGPEDGVLAVRTGRAGAAAKAGHNLVIHATEWSATLVVGVGDGATPSSLELDADGSALRVHKGTGGIQSLGDEEMASIHQSIDDDVLKKTPVRFRSTAVEVSEDGGTLRVEGELELVGAHHPAAFALEVSGDGRLTGTADLTQSDWGIKPYSTLFGALKVSDAVKVKVDVALPAPG